MASTQTDRYRKTAPIKTVTPIAPDADGMFGSVEFDL